MKKYLLMILALLSANAMANEDLSVSASAVYGTRTSIYKGKESFYIPAFVNLKYKNFYVSGTELGANFFSQDKFNAYAFLELRDGHAVKGSKMNAGYQSIDRRKFQQAVGLKADLELDDLSNLDIKLSPFFKIGNRGFTTGAKLSSVFRPVDNIVISPYASATYLSKRYTDYYFGVDANEIGGNISNTYSPDGAMKFGAGVYGEYYFTKNISALAFINMDKYSSDVTKSPIVEDRIITNIGAGLKYTF